MHRIKLIPKVKWLKGGGEGATPKVIRGQEDADTEHMSRKARRNQRRENLDSLIAEYSNLIMESGNMSDLNTIYLDVLQTATTLSNRLGHKLIQQILPVVQAAIQQRRLSYSPKAIPSAQDYRMWEKGDPAERIMIHSIKNKPKIQHSTNEEDLYTVNWGDTKIYPSIEENIAARLKQPVIEEKKPVSKLGEPKSQLAVVSESTTPAAKTVTEKTELSTSTSKPLNTLLILRRQNTTIKDGKDEVIRLRNDSGENGKIIVYHPGPYNSVQYYEIDLTKRTQRGYRMTPVIYDKQNNKFIYHPKKDNFIPQYFGSHSQGHYYLVPNDFQVTTRADELPPSTLGMVNYRSSINNPTISKFERFFWKYVPPLNVAASLVADLGNVLWEDEDYSSIPYLLKWSEIK